MADADLLTLEEFRTIQGTDVTDTQDDAKWTMMLGFVSAVIRSFTERDFGAPIVTEDRVFAYDGSGYLDIDDAAAITAVVFNYPYSADITITTDQWSAQPQRRDDAQIYTYILLFGDLNIIPGSPEMGFERNLDVYARERGTYGLPRTATVSGTWGWAVIPDDVKMAAVWTMQEWVSRPSGDSLTAEAIEGWSRSWGTRTGVSATAMAIPARALDILSNYSKIDV